MQIRLLGEVQVVDSDGQIIPIPGERPKAVVALLALEAPLAVSSDRLIESFWGDNQPDRPELALQVAVSRLRAAAGSDLVQTVAGGYRFGPPTGFIDIERFRHHVRRARQLLTLGQLGAATEGFRQALAIWRGPALSDLRHLDFAEHAARIVEEERLSALEELLEADLAAGNHAVVIGELTGLVETFPLREKLWGTLMLALYRSGRQAEALRAFGRLKEILAEELGVEPSQEVVDLEDQILLHDPLLTEASTPSGAEDWVDDREVITFAAGELIFEDGSPADCVYWIEDGRVEVATTNADGGTQTLEQLGPGRYFGELAALLRTSRTASVRAVVPTVLSIHDVDSFRRRLGLDRAQEPVKVQSAQAVRHLVDLGEYLRAYDSASLQIERGDLDPELRYLAVLSLARSGAYSQARKRYEVLELGSIGNISTRLAEDVAALKGRLDKDIAFASTGETRQAWARRSASSYSDAYARHSSAYLAVNAATMSLVAGDRQSAIANAEKALASLQNEEHGAGEDAYWAAATEAEAALILRQTERASEALAQAALNSLGNRAARASTIRQLKVVCELLELEPDLLMPLANPAVAHYCGHRISPKGQPGRFRAEDEQRVKIEISELLSRLDVGIAFGSLAAGADILAAEALLDRGGELHVHLPFGRNDFVRTSVQPAGDGWVPRFDRCLDRAAGVAVSMIGDFDEDPVLFDYASRIAMGDAFVRAMDLQTEAHQIAVWDGLETGEPAGTSVDIRTWRATGRPATIISVEGTKAPVESLQIEPNRRVRTLLFGEFAGFSKLTDSQVLTFQRSVMAGLGRTIERYESDLLSGRTWSDGFYLVFDDVTVAAECALSLQRDFGQLSLATMQLDALRGLRIAAHVSPVFDGWDPISGSRLFFGAGVTQVARIEPRTPEGEVYVTRAFAALASLQGGTRFAFQYVGTVPVARGFGSLPLFSLRRGS